MWKLAIIGCSKFVYDFLYDCTKKYPLELVAICDSRPNAEAFSARYRCPALFEDYKEMLERMQPDLVISFPNYEDQYEVARDCLLAGAHVLAERPVCLSSDQARSLAEIERQTHRYVMARLNRRFTPSYAMAKQVIAGAEFGQPAMYLAKYHASAYESEQSFLWNHTVHHLDVARYLLGELTLLHAERVCADPQRVGYNISFRSEGGCIGVIQTSSLQCGEYPMERVEITGHLRNVVVDNIRSVQYYRPAPKREKIDEMSFAEGGDTLVWTPNFAQLNNFTFYGFENMFEHLVQCLAAGDKPALHMGDTLKTLELVERLGQLIEPERNAKQSILP